VLLAHYVKPPHVPEHLDQPERFLAELGAHLSSA